MCLNSDVQHNSFRLLFMELSAIDYSLSLISLSLMLAELLLQANIRFPPTEAFVPLPVLILKFSAFYDI